MQLVNSKIAGRWTQWLMLLGLCVVLWMSTTALSGEPEDGGGVLRSRVYSLKHITSEQARDLFSQLNIGKSYNLLAPDVLILTSNVGPDLVAATEIISVLDRTPLVQIRTLMVASESQPLPPLDEFFATLGTISAGTMTEAPPKASDSPAIIDVLDNELIAIAAEDVLTQIETAIDDWKKGHPASTSEMLRQESPVMVTLSETVNKSEEITEPNGLGLAPEPNDLAESALETPAPIEPAAVEKPALDPVADDSQQPDPPSLDEVAQQVFEAPSVTDANAPSAAITTEPAQSPAEPNAPAAQEPPLDAEPQEPQQESEEDFLSEGLLQELAAAQQKAASVEDKASVEPVTDETVVAKAAEEARPEQTEDVPETAAVEESVGETEKDPLEIMRALLAQSKAEEERALAAQKEAEAAAELEQEAAKEAELKQAPSPETETGKIQTAEPPAGDSPLAGGEPKAAALEAELSLLRQKLAELEAKVVEEKAPAAETAAEEEKPTAADPAQSKVQTADSVQTQPQIDSQLAEKELDTVIDLPQEVELESLVDLVGKQLGLNYMYDPIILKNQKVQLKLHGGKIKVKDTYALLESVLRFKGFIMTRRDELVTIMKQADIAKAEPVLRGADDPIQPGDIVVSSMFELEHIDTASAQNMLKGMNLGTAFIPIAGTNTLVVTDFAYRMDRIQRVLDMIDVAGEEKEYEFRTLKYMKPSEIVPKLQELAKQLEGVSLQISTPAAAAAPKTRTVRTRDPKTGRTITKQVPITTSTPAAAAKTPQADAVFIDTDDRTNRILMAGKADQITLINELIDALDVPQYDLKTVREYIIQNVEAGEVIDVLNELALATVTVSAQKTSSTVAGRTPATSRTTPTRTPTPRTPTAPKGAAGGEQPYISVRPATNSLLVNATQEQHSAIELVIAHVDVVQKDQRTIRQYEIQYVDTQEIIETLTDLEIIAPQTTSTGSRSTSSRSSSRSTTSRSPQQPTKAGEGAAPLSLPSASGGSQKDITADQPQISVLETTNSLLVYATPRQHDAIALVIAHADRQLDTSSTPYVVYALENQDPLELAEVLTKLIQETVEQVKKTSTPTSKIQTGGATQTANLPTLEEQNIRVIPDEMSYSLIVYANKRNQQWISELIEELDEYRPQVLLDCTLVQISRDDEFQYSVDLLAKTYGGSEFQPSSPVDDAAAWNIGDAAYPIGDFSASRLADASSIGGSFTGFFNSEMIQGLLTAMQKDGFGRVMSQPKILVNDNQEGEIKTENITSVAQQKSIVQPGSDIGNTITTTDVSFVEYTSGVTLKIKPHISKGDMLRLEIALNRTDFDDSVKNVLVAGNLYPQPPDLISADVTTIATVPDGTTIILGGLESVDQSKTQYKVPLLGDLPLIGTLFRNVDNKDQLSKLYVFVKANIIRPGDQAEGLEDIRRVSKKYRDDFEEMETKFQDLQDFPGIKPPPMEPERVLEDDFVAEENWPVG